MKKTIGFIAVMVLVCFATMVFAADAAAPAAAAPAKAEAAKDNVIQGKITKKDVHHFTITVNGKMISVSPNEQKALKKGDMVKITLSADNPKVAEKIEVIKAAPAAKKEPKKEVKAEEKPVEKKAE